MMKWMNRHTEKLTLGDEQTAGRGLGSLQSPSPNSPVTPQVKSLSQFTAATFQKLRVLVPRTDYSLNKPWPDLHEVYFYSDGWGLIVQNLSLFVYGLGVKFTLQYQNTKYKTIFIQTHGFFEREI